MTTRVWALSVDDRQALIRAAFEAKEHSYSPYSKFPVGAALMAADGSIIKGANIENASYGGTICAERTAIVKAVASSHSSRLPSRRNLPSYNRIVCMLSLRFSNVPATISPCGMCRQVIREFCALDMPVLLVPGDYPKSPDDKTDEGRPGITEGGVRETSLGELLPDSFGPEHLELPRK